MPKPDFPTKLTSVAEVSPVIRATSSDELLNAALLQHPPLFHKVRQEASALFEEIRSSGFSAPLGVDIFWHNARREMFAESPRAPGGTPPLSLVQLRAALEAHDVLSAIAADLKKFSVAETMTLRFLDRSRRRGTERQDIRAVMERHPGLAALLARQDSAALVADEIARAGRAHQADAEAARHAAARVTTAIALISRLAALGIILSGSKKGISASPPSLLAADDRADVRDLRTELLDILTASQELIA